MNISDSEFDKVIAGKGASDPEAAELKRILAQVNSAFVGPIPPASESRHLAAIQQANRSRSPASPSAAPAGFKSAMQPFLGFLETMRRSGYAHLSGATAVWAVVVALFLVSATGGLAAAGVLPDSLQSAVSSAAASVGIQVPMPQTSVSVSEPANSGGVSVTEGSLAAQQAALASAEKAVQEASQAQKAAQEAAATSARCIEESMAEVSTLVDGILSATSPAQAQALVTRAGSLGGGVKACADQATALGQAGVVHAGEATRLAREASAAEPVASNQVLAAIDAANNAARTAGTSATRALDMSRSIVDNVSTLAAGLINSSLGLQQTLNTPVPPPPATGAPAAAPPPPANVADP
ncbi:MAG TPA: hypothetical protein VFO95_12485, partial [Gemmatimonadales bacterium]|nr:hypothetical protein [Gemmatimonadales bacterium]